MTEQEQRQHQFQAAVLHHLERQTKAAEQTQLWALFLLIAVAMGFLVALLTFN